MWTARGPRWEDGGFVDGWVTVEGGLVVDAGRGAPPRPADAAGVLVPSLVNAHTHVADRLARGKIPDGVSLEEAGAPPHGLKHRLLARATSAELRDAMRAACMEAYSAGTRVLYDFREGGREGARGLALAASGSGVRPVVLARPAAGGVGDPGELAEALRDADGLGLSALRDVAPEAARATAAAARAAGKRFALHWSEGERESVDDALDLRPDFLVHAVRATAGDLDRLADARVPVVLCPRSNARLVRALPDLPGMLARGIDVAFGSDNAMLQTVSVLDELSAAREAWPDVPAAALVAAAVDAPRRRLAPPGAMRAWEPGEPADFVVLRRADDPFAAVLGAGAAVAARPPMR